MDAICTMNPYDQIHTWLEEFKDVSLYQTIFEDADPAVAGQLAKNGEIAEKSVSLLQRIIAGIRKLIKTIQEKLKSIFDYFTASTDERKSFEDFCKEIQADPEFKGTKVTFHDYRKIVADMDSSCKQFEKEYQAFKESEAEDNPNLMKTISNKLQEAGIKCKEVLAAEASSFTVEVAIAYAKQSNKHAREVQDFINFNTGLLNAIEKELGSKETRKFKKKIAKLTNRSKMVQGILSIRRKEADTLADAIREVGGNLSSLWKVHRRALKGAHKDEVKASEKAIIKVGMQAHDAQKEGKRAAKAHVKGLENKAKGIEYDIKDNKRVNKALDKKFKKADVNKSKEQERLKSASAVYSASAERNAKAKKMRKEKRGW